MLSQNPRKSSLYRTRHKITIIIRKSHPHIIPNLTFQSSLISRKSILFSPFYRTKITISPKHYRSHKNFIQFNNSFNHAFNRSSITILSQSHYRKITSSHSSNREYIIATKNNQSKSLIIKETKHENDKI